MEQMRKKGFIQLSLTTTVLYIAGHTGSNALVSKYSLMVQSIGENHWVVADGMLPGRSLWGQAVISTWQAIQRSFNGQTNQGAGMVSKMVLVAAIYGQDSLAHPIPIPMRAT